MRHRNFLLFTVAAAILAAGLLAAPAGATDDSYSYVRIVRLSYVNGDVQMVRADESSKWEAAYANMPIQQGFTLGTNNGRAEVEFENGSALWLAENSMIQFTELALSDGGHINKMTLLTGTATFEANLRPGDSFVVSTGKFQVTPTVKSRFRVDAFSEGGTVTVMEGRANVTSGSGAREVANGQMYTLDSAANQLETVRRNPSLDDWDRWVNNRENYLVNGETQALQYTNSPFSYGMADLSSYGMWNNYSGCGYGWQPFGMGAGWMPFLNGQWLYYPAVGWTWVSFEPWGWMPYHFGSWMNCGGNGWVWMPGSYGFWNAAPVQWVSVGRGRLGWRPIPPRVNPVRAGRAPIVVASKNLGKEGEYKVEPESKIANETRELAGPPEENGKVPNAGAMPGREGEVGGRLAVVPTSTSLATLRNELANAAPGRAIRNEAAPPLRAGTPAGPGVAPRLATLNAAPPPPTRMPSMPPARTYTFAPSRPGQASYAPASGTRGWSGASAGESRGGYAPSSSSRGSMGSAPAPAGRAGGSAPAASAPSAPAGGGGRPH